MFVMVLGGVLAAAALPQVMAGLTRSRARIAARYLAGEMALARAQSVSRAAAVGIRFGPENTGYEMTVFVDGNRNGIRSRDIESGTDRPIRPAERLSDRFPGVTIGVSLDVGVGADPVRLGSSSVLTFTPYGTARSGSVYVRGRDGSQFVVRILGATARTRVQRFVPASGTWTDP